MPPFFKTIYQNTQAGYGEYKSGYFKFIFSKYMGEKLVISNCFLNLNEKEKLIPRMNFAQIAHIHIKGEFLMYIF